jgi:tRNA (guanine37-N1)-methyltransferase
MRRISIGNYILTGGESAALIVIDSIARLVPGVIKDASHQEESFSESFDGKIEYPHYTRPEVWRDMSVPSVLLS